MPEHFEPGDAVYIPTSILRDPHVRTLSVSARVLWIESLYYRRKGVITPVDLLELITAWGEHGANVDMEALVRELVDGGFWLVVEGGWWPVPDWQEPR